MKISYMIPQPPHNLLRPSRHDHQARHLPHRHLEVHLRELEQALEDPRESESIAAAAASPSAVAVAGVVRVGGGRGR